MTFKYWLWLTMVFGVGNNRLWDVMQYFDNPISAYEELCRGEHDFRLKENELQNVQTLSLEKCNKIMEFCESKGYGIAGYNSREYPQYLRHIYNPPAVIFYQGNIEILNQKPSVTMVGTRRATSQSLTVTARLSSELAQSGFVISSGFAVGVDITAHMATANQGLPTVCVLGCGIDVNYPKDNFQYRDIILNNGGVFITEYFPGTSPYPQNFPKRNRILSGISRAVIVVEAGDKSGSLITAELALEQGREVFCIPPANIYDERYSGNVKFLRDGAFPVYGSEDVTCYFDMFKEQISISEDEIEYDSDENEDNDEDIEESVNAENETAVNETEFVSETLEKTEENSTEFSDIQKQIIRLLMCEKMHTDVISEKLGIDISDIMIELTELELDGVVISFPGKMYGLS